MNAHPIRTKWITTLIAISLMLIIVGCQPAAPSTVTVGQGTTSGGGFQDGAATPASIPGGGLNNDSSGKGNEHNGPVGGLPAPTEAAAAEEPANRAAGSSGTGTGGGGDAFAPPSDDSGSTSSGPGYMPPAPTPAQNT